MARYTKTNVTTGDTVKSDVNVQLGLIETAMADTLSRVGDSPNTMSADIDMNSNQVLNLPNAVTRQEPATYGQVLDQLDWSVAVGEAKYYDTVAAATSDTSLVVGDVVILKDRANGVFDVISGTGTANTYNIIAHGSLSLSLELISSYEVDVRQYGASGDGSTASNLAIQAAFNSGANVVNLPFVAVGYNIQSPGLSIPSNVTIVQDGKLIIDSNILASAVIGAIQVDTKTNVVWKGGGLIDASGAAAYDNNIFGIQDNTDCDFSGIRIVDSPNNRYPLGPVRSLRNTRNTYMNIKMTGVADTGMMTNTDVYCTYDKIRSFDGVHTALETTLGEHNTWSNCVAHCPTNVTYSAFSFNDKWSTSSGNITVGGAFGITGGHVGTPSDHSTISGCVVDTPATNGIQLQATVSCAVTGNAVDGSGTNAGLLSANSAKFNTWSGNTIAGAWANNVKLGEYSVATGNISVGGARGFRNAVDNKPAVFLGNMALNGTGTGFDFGIASSQAENILIGNHAGDDQGTATQLNGFRSLSTKNNLIGNSTDGNHTTTEFTGTFSSSLQKDTSITAAVAFATSDATPSVISSADFFETADTTTYTDFDNVRGDGHTFKLLALHAATVTDGANIMTSTGANKTLTVDVVYEFTSRSGVWYETATA